MVTNGILRRVGWGCMITCATRGHFGTSVCCTKTHPSLPCFQSDAGRSRLVLSGPQVWDTSVVQFAGTTVLSPNLTEQLAIKILLAFII